MTLTNAQLASVPEFIADMLREPMAQRLALRIHASGDNRIYTAEDVLGERILRLASLIQIEYTQPGHVLCQNPPDGDRLKAMLALTKVAVSASPYLWTEEVREAIRALKIPRHVVSPRALPQPRSWHTFETGIQLGGILRYNGRRYEGETADALIVHDVGTGIQALTFGEMTDSETGDNHPCLTGGIIPYNKTFPDDFHEEGARKHAEAVLTMLAFLNSPFIPKEQRQISRSARREAQRAGRPTDDLVTFMILRRPTGSRGEPLEQHSVEWKHRWLVNGHLRAQWYPSEQAHRLIWIAPYLKGPADAPMLSHVYKVAQ